MIHSSERSVPILTKNSVAEKEVNNKLAALREIIGESRYMFGIPMVIVRQKGSITKVSQNNYAFQDK